MASVCLVGATGLVGAHILRELQSSAKVERISAFTRRDLPTDSKTTLIKSDPSSTWPEHYPNNTDLFISGLGTTRGQAGGFDKQRKIDYDLNLDLAKAARAAGTKVYVLVSSSGSDSSSMIPYSKMKGELEDAVKAIDFDHVVILRPGLLVGQRAAHDVRTPELVFRKIASFAGAISGDRLKNFWAQDADIVGRAAFRVGLEALDGEHKEKTIVLSQADIVRLGQKS